MPFRKYFLLVIIATLLLFEPAILLAGPSPIRTISPGDRILDFAISPPHGIEGTVVWVRSDGTFAIRADGWEEGGTRDGYFLRGTASLGRDTRILYHRAAPIVPGQAFSDSGVAAEPGVVMETTLSGDFSVHFQGVIDGGQPDGNFHYELPYPTGKVCRRKLSRL